MPNHLLVVAPPQELAELLELLDAFRTGSDMAFSLWSDTDEEDDEVGAPRAAGACALRRCVGCGPGVSWMKGGGKVGARNPTRQACDR